MVTRNVLDVYDERTDLKKKGYKAEGAKNTGKETRRFRKK